MVRKVLVLILTIFMLASVCGCEENAPILPNTVTFVTNGGVSVSPRTVTALENAPVTSREGYVFAGWYLDKVMSVQATFPLIVTSDMTLYAKWVKVVYCVSFDSNGGTYISDEETDFLQSAPSPRRAEHKFEGWYLDSTLTTPAAFPLTVDKDITLYAKWLKTSGIAHYKEGKIKFLDDELSSSIRYTVTPNGFDLSTLAAQGYHVNIEVQYDVRYEKDYNVWLDIGYAGSPKYEVSLMGDEGYGKHQNDLGTNKSADTRTIKTQCSASALMSENIYLRFSTDNVQNIIYFENIVVTYDWFK